MSQTRTSFESYKAELRQEWEGSLVPLGPVLEPLVSEPAVLDLMATQARIAEQLFAHVGIPAELLAESYDGRCFY